MSKHRKLSLIEMVNPLDGFNTKKLEEADKNWYWISIGVDLIYIDKKDHSFIVYGTPDGWCIEYRRMKRLKSAIIIPYTSPKKEVKELRDVIWNQAGMGCFEWE